MNKPERFDNASELQLIYIPSQDIGRVWPKVEHLIPSIVERSYGRETPATVFERFATGKGQMWVVFDGQEIHAIVGTDLGDAPTGMKIASIAFATGEQSHKWLHLIDVVEEWAVKNGCQKMELLARKGWARKLPDYRMTHVFLEKDLNENV